MHLLWLELPAEIIKRKSVDLLVCVVYIHVAYILVCTIYYMYVHVHCKHTYFAVQLCTLRLLLKKVQLSCRLYHAHYSFSVTEIYHIVSQSSTSNEPQIGGDMAGETRKIELKENGQGAQQKSKCCSNK